MRFRLLATLVSVAALLLAAGPAHAESGDPVRAGSMFKNGVTKRLALPAPTPAGSEQKQVYADRIAALTNAERARHGLAALRVSGCADGFADTWATRLASAGALSHQSLTVVLRSCGARGAGENVAYGNVSADQMVAMWMGSPGHRANILNASFTHLGVGVARTSTGRVYGVQDFLS